MGSGGGHGKVRRVTWHSEERMSELCEEEEEEEGGRRRRTGVIVALYHVN